MVLFPVEFSTKASKYHRNPTTLDYRPEFARNFVARVGFLGYQKKITPFYPPHYRTELSFSLYINNLDKVMKDRIKDKIDRLEEDPFPQEVERAKDYKGEKVFRVRVGNQRILYIVRYNPNKLIITKVDKRSRVYG